MVKKLRHHWTCSALLTVCVLWSILISPLSSYTAQAIAEPIMPPIQRLEAAYLYNFLLFVHWPQEDQVAGQSTMTICIVDNDPLAQGFAPVEGKFIKNTKFVLKIKPIRLPIQKSDLAGCSMLFLSELSPGSRSEILAQVKGLPILTVSDQPNFAHDGGMIALVEHNNKLRWRINQSAANQVGLKFDAQLLRNAETVITAGRKGE